MDIKTYFDDGANWQAQAVLAYVRAYSSWALDGTWDDEAKKYMATLDVGRFENCREQGYIFSVRYKTSQMNYAVYEHRNSDNISVVRFECNTMNTPTNDMVFEHMADKYDTTKDFVYGNIVACGEWIVKDMNNFVRSLI